MDSQELKPGQDGNVQQDTAAPPPPQTQQPPPPPPPAPQPQGTSRKGCLIFTVVAASILCLLGVLFVIVLLAFYALGSGISSISSDLALSPTTPARKSFREEYISGSYLSSNKIVAIDVRGIILNGVSGLYETASSGLICEQLEQARKDRAKAVVLMLETPGGEVTAADTIHNKIMQLKQDGIKIVSHMGSVAASGGYYIAAPSDFIVANKHTTTGSIGVIIQTYNYHDLFNKIGVFAETYKSGAMKDMLDGSRIRTEAEKKIAQDLVSEVYDDFVCIVAEGRKSNGLTVEKIKSGEIGDGRIFSGQKAKELGLVDAIGYKDDAIQKAAELAGIEGNYKLVWYVRKFSFLDALSEMKAPESKIELKLPGANSWSSLLEPGKVYLLPELWK